MSPHKAFSGSRTSQIICIGYLLCILLFSQRIYLTNSLVKRGSSSRTGVAKAMTAVIFFPLGSPPPVWEICFSFLYAPKYLKLKKIFFSYTSPLKEKREKEKLYGTVPHSTEMAEFSAQPGYQRETQSEAHQPPRRMCAQRHLCRLSSVQD